MLYSQVFLFQIETMTFCNHWKYGLIASAAAFIVAACTPADTGQTKALPLENKTDTAVKSDIATPEHHARIIDFITQGDQALQAGDGAALRKAAQGLQILGASPLNGREDLAKNWLVTAQTISADEGFKTAPYRGRIKGPAYRKQSLAAGEQDVIEDVYYAAEAAQMTLKSLDGPKLYWEIIEAQSDSKPVCAGQTLDKPQSCRFTPLWTAKYNIRISNISGQDTTYLFITN